MEYSRYYANYYADLSDDSAMIQAAEGADALCAAQQRITELPEMQGLFPPSRAELFGRAEPDAFALTDRFVTLTERVELPLLTIQMAFFLGMA